jgi:hypothetical protein
MTGLGPIGDSGLHAHGYDLIPESAVKECPTQAESLSTVARIWLKTNRPDPL